MVTRTKAEDFLELVERARRGRLKVYLGFAAGVGKTYRMLEEAHALRKRGVDIVLGYVEPHDRPDTIAFIEGLEVVPRKRLAYRGVEVDDMDLDAVLVRKPQVAIVDEVAHTNAPGMRNRKRYEDILTLLDAGINVICAFNIQHLESLNDVVERTTAVSIRERVPDHFLRQADQIITVDLAVEDLLERLRSGKIYGTDKVPTALSHFFTDQNLATLRELALREVAQNVERTTAARPPTAAQSGTDDRVMVCISSYSPRAPVLMRRGSRIAGRLNTDWYVAYVQTPNESPERIDATVQRHLHDNIDLARQLGAEVVRLRGHDPVAALLDFARSHRVGQLIIGRSHQPWYKRLAGRDVVQKLVQEAHDLDIVVIAMQTDTGAP
jgi:two-component system, OmpR family, sensor histidine kinase KdpD